MTPCNPPTPLLAQSKIDKYFLAIKKNEGDVLKNLHIYTPLLPPKGRFYADPFLFKQEGLNYLFFEDYDYVKGVISYVTIDAKGRISQPSLALERPVHLSFPFVFQEGSDIYMIPETYDYGAIFLFKATEFPTKWIPQQILVRGALFADSILFKHRDYYWLFTSVQTDILEIYYAKNLAGPFLPHPINGQKVRGRNAGPVYSINGKLIRPNMNCTKVYGESVTLKEIVLLDTEYLVEKEIALIEPNWAEGLNGTHGYCQNEDYVVYDGRRTIFAHEHFTLEHKVECDQTAPLAEISMREAKHTR